MNFCAAALLRYRIVHINDEQHEVITVRTSVLLTQTHNSVSSVSLAITCNTLWIHLNISTCLCVVDAGLHLTMDLVTPECYRQYLYTVPCSLTLIQFSILSCSFSGSTAHIFLPGFSS